MKNKKAVKILFALLIMLFFVLISKSFSSVDAATFGPDFAHSYSMSGGGWTAYCREEGKALGGNIGGNPINALEYNQDSGMQHIEPATGYALYCGASGDSLQRVIWYSKIWTGGGNAVVDADSGDAGIDPDPRFKAYGDVYYGIIAPYKKINSSNKNLFTITDDIKDENVKVMVNQQKKKYIVGPFKLKLNPSIPNYSVSSESLKNPTLETKQALIAQLKNEDKNSKQKDESYYENLAESIMNNTDNNEYLNMDNLFNNGVFNVSDVAKQELYNELLNWKKLDKPFAKFEIIKDLQGINGDPNSFRLLDSNGNEIQFPDFINETEFYIEFTPNNDGNIQYAGTPIIKIEWLDDFYYNVNGAWSVVSAKANGVPTEYSVTSSSSTDYNSSECKFYKTEQIRVPVHVGASGTVVGYLTGTLNYISTVGKVHYSTGSYQVTVGTHTVTRYYSYADGYDRVGEYWVLDESNSTTSWNYQWGSPFQRIDGEITQTTGGDGDSTGHWGEAISKIAINKLCNIEIGGTVWLESPDNKTANIDGKLGTGDKPFAGIQVQLYDVTQGNTAVVGGNGDQGKLIAVTTTDKNGHYRFFGTNDIINGSYTDALGQKHSMRELLLNPLHKYYVTFVYNGQLYQPTYYHKQLTSPGYSNAKDMSREEFNAKFTRIDSDTANYKSPGTNAWNRAYSIKHKLKTNDGSYISFNNSALTYEDAWKQFLTYATNTRNYDLNPKSTD